MVIKSGFEVHMGLRLIAGIPRERYARQRAVNSRNLVRHDTTLITFD